MKVPQIVFIIFAFLPSNWGQPLDSTAIPGIHVGDNISFDFSGSFDDNDKLFGEATITVVLDNVDSTKIKYSYDGQWNDGVAEGDGTEISPLGQYDYPLQTMRYVGQFSNGKHHGSGNATYYWCGK